MKRLAIALAASAVLFAAQSLPARAEPAMWVVRDADSEITLFGSVHLLPRDQAWRSPALNAAFAKAEEVWFELDITPEAQRAAQGAALSLGLSPARPLSAALTPAQRAKVSAAVKTLGLPDQQMEGMRPWLAALTLSVAQMARAGFAPDAGVEKVLAQEVAGRPTKAFETPEQQIRFFADLPEDVQVDFLMNTVAELDSGPDLLGRMVAEWAEGDVAALEALFLGQMRQERPELFEALITRRNAAWVERILRELEGAGSDFMIVGAGHLVGPGGVPALLAARGVSVTPAPAAP